MASAAYVIALTLITLGMVCLLASYRLQQAIRSAESIESADETYELTKLRGPLIDGNLLIAGQPDNLIRVVATGELIPVVKVEHPAPERITALQENHIRALCFLAERVYGRRSPYGVLRFADQDISVSWSGQFPLEIKDIVLSVRAAATATDVPRSHDEPIICQECRFRAMCNERLAD